MIISSIYQGLLYGILGLGIYMTFRILDFPDLTTEGSFPLGGAVAVTLMNFGWNPILATLVAVLAGCGAGLVTGLLYTKGEIPTILAGILVMTSLNSVMLMIMGRANLGLLDIKTIQDLLPFSKDYNLLIVGLIATCDNRDMARSFGINTDSMEVMGLVISNGIIALSGALISQQDGYADVSKGIGVIVIGLASIIIGEVLYTTNLTLLERLIAICVGSILYQFLLTAVIALGFNTNYLKLFSAIVLALCLISPVLRRKFFKGVSLSR